MMFRHETIGTADGYAKRRICAREIESSRNNKLTALFL